MSIRTEAEENLRIIRSLMEKATVYRAISAPGALIGGLISAGVTGVEITRPVANGDGQFLTVWLVVLAATAALNFWLLRRDAVRRGEPFISAGMRLALRAMVPALIGGGLSILLGREGQPALVASLWVFFYGISLLAASHFAPQSICWLGRAFFCAGATLVLWGALKADWWRGPGDARAASLIMGATFGLFHLIYAACTWPRRPAETAAAGL